MPTVCEGVAGEESDSHGEDGLEPVEDALHERGEPPIWGGEVCQLAARGG